MRMKSLMRCLRHVFFWIIAPILFIFGLILLFVDVGLPGIILPIFAVVLHLNPLSITFLLVGFISELYFLISDG